MKLIWVFLIGILIVAGLVVLQKLGIINWQLITILTAALAAPFKLISSFFSSDKSKLQAITDQHQAVRDEEHKYQQELEARVKAREGEVDTLNKDIETLNNKMKTLEDKNNNIEQLIRNMSDEEKKQKFKDMFGE
jgi:TolA-binding protein